jgi:cobalt-zinc-cadmium efflux system membrane fusion protein
MRTTRRGKFVVILGLFAAGLLAAALFIPARRGGAGKENHAKSADQETGLLPTEAQWKNLKIEPVRLAAFSTKHQAEGKIAINDYKTTPVFSPYSGRVTRVFAEAGPAVTQGQPLFAIEASEFV